MRIGRMIGGSAAALALLTTSITPAMARWYGGGSYGWSNWGGGDGYGRHHRRHRGDDDTGEVLAGVLIGAVLVGILSSASKKSKEARRTSSSDRRPDDRSSSGRINSENAAVDACAEAAEQRGGEMARVRDISNVRSSSDGWDVEGTLEQRTSWRDRAPKKRDFTCSVRLGEVDSVYIDGDAVALAN